MSTSETSSASAASAPAEVIVSTARPIRVGGVDAPWHVTTETYRPADAEGGGGLFHNRDRLRLYRGDMEVYAVEYHFLSEVDAAKRALHKVVSMFEGERIRALAFMEALREAGAAEEVVRLVKPAGFGSGESNE